MVILAQFGGGAGLVSTAISTAPVATSAGTALGTVGAASFSFSTALVGGALVGTSMDQAFTALSGQHLGAAIYDWTHG